MSPNPPKDSAPRPLAVRVGGWLLAPVLGLAAIGLQWQLDVPKGEMIPRPTKKEEAKRARDKANRQREKARAKSSKNRGWYARPSARVATLRASWFHQPIEDEPVHKEFQRYHDTIVRAAVSTARREVGVETPPPLRTRPGCHMIRCDLNVCGPTDFLEQVATILPELSDSRGPLWHSFEELEVPEVPSRAPTQSRSTHGTPEDPTGPTAQGEGAKEGPDHAKPEQDAPAETSCRRWVVSFERDKVARHELRYGEAVDGPVDGKDGKDRMHHKGLRPAKGKGPRSHKGEGEGHRVPAG